MPDELSGPYLVAALVCEKVLNEKDGVLSLIRLVDRFFRPRPSPPQIPPQPIQGALVLIFKGGGLAPGNYKIKLLFYKPNTSDPSGVMEREFFFEGGQDKGVNLIVPLLMLADEEGLFWIEVMFEGVLMTRIPFRVIFLSVPLPQPPPTPGA